MAGCSKHIRFGDLDDMLHNNIVSDCMNSRNIVFSGESDVYDNDDIIKTLHLSLSCPRMISDHIPGRKHNISMRSVKWL